VQRKVGFGRKVGEAEESVNINSISIMPARNFKDYDVWKDARILVKEVYELTSTFPSSERKGLVDQIQRAVVSIPSNIAEGSARSNADFARFLEISLGSAYEVETQLILANDLGYINLLQLEKVEIHIQHIVKQLTNFVEFLKRSK